MPRSPQRIPAARALRNDGERERLRQRQLFRWFVKIDQACCRDTFDVAAIGGDVEIGLENLVLAVKSLKLDRADDLLNLPMQSSRVDAEKIPSELHRDSGTADATASAEICGAEGTQDRK